MDAAAQHATLPPATRTSGTPPHLNRVSTWLETATENSPPPRSGTPSSAKSSSEQGIHRPLGAVKQAKEASSSGFGLHRPRSTNNHQSPARPVVAPLAQPPAPPPTQGQVNTRADQRPNSTNNGPSRLARPRATRPSQAASNRPIAAPRWTRDPEAKFRVTGLPREWDTKAIHSAMVALGNVTYIDIPQDQKSSDAYVVYVTFTPPPRDYEAVQRGHALRARSDGRQCEISFYYVPPVNTYRTREQEPIAVHAASIDFGVMKSEDTMLGLHSVQASPHEKPTISINTPKGFLQLEFAVPSSMIVHDRTSPYLPAQYQYRMELPLSQITTVTQMQDCQTGATAFVLSIAAPPLVYRKTDNPLGSHAEGSTRWSERKLWFRQIEIEENLEVARHAIKQLQRDSPIIDIGRWLTYRLVFKGETTSSQVFRQFHEALEKHSISIDKVGTIRSQFAATKAMAMWSWLDSPAAALKAGDALSSLSDLQQMAHQTIQLPFDVRYQLESCISHGCLHECNIDQAFLEKLAAMAFESDHSKLRTVKLLEKVVEEGRRFFNPDDIFRKVVPRMSGALKQRQHATHYVRVLTATVTPTTIYFNAPSLEPSNRVIRHFRQHEDRFLRVRFSDEKYKGKIFGSEEAQDVEVFTRVKRTMTNGIKVGDRVYEFLAFGNSQFKENGAYFFAATGDLNAAKIREWMGNFSHIKVVAKYCSRIGQGLSTTRATQNKSFREIRIPDIEHNGFCFSDGVGKISPMLAVLIASEVGMLKPHAATGTSEGYHYPSAFQFRMGGSKGVLAVDPSMGSERSVAIRPSQEKFSMVKHAGLEICRISDFTSASLNVQIILILSGLGVGDEVFTDMMDVMLADIELAMSNESKAIELLQKNIDQNGATVQVAQMISDGFMERQDPFMMSCLRLWRSWSLKYLKEKQRIFVEQGAFILGCIDETATLEGHYDDKPDQLPEIFLQIPDKEHEGRYRVVEGVCMLARNPSLHPGDVRIVRAVQCKPLMHMRNCVVLPQKGDRDIANMCSGGDLDGDDYMVIWDTRLIPPREEWNHAPMDYQAPPAKEAHGTITVDDMTSFFVTHMKYDNVGKIATLHKCWADREPEGVKSDKCKKLAALHSKAVDYAKTGMPAELPKDLHMIRRPHWYERARGGPTYTSERIIGKLYDRVKRVDFVPAWDLPFDSRILDAYPLSDAILTHAREVKEQYDEAVRRIMAKYDIHSDFEVWSTFVLAHGAEYNDYKFAEKIGDEAFALRERFQKLCHERISADESEQRDWTKKGPFVAAMYAVTAREVRAALDECEQKKTVGGVEVPVREKSVRTMPFMSFPWLFATEMGWIANKRAGYSSQSTVLGRPGARGPSSQQAQQAARTRQILGDVPQPAPLQELVVDDSEIEEVEDMLPGIRYTGPRLLESAIFSQADESGPLIEMEVSADDSSASVPIHIPSTDDSGTRVSSSRPATTQHDEEEDEVFAEPAPVAEDHSDGAGPGEQTSSALDDHSSRVSPAEPNMLSEPVVAASEAGVCLEAGDESTAPGNEVTERLAGSGDDESDEEVEVVALPVQGQKSAFDALEALLES